MSAAEFLGIGIPGRVGNIDDGGAGLDHRLDHAVQKRRFGPSCVLGVKLHVLNERARQFYRRGRALQRLFAADPELVLKVAFGNADARYGSAAVLPS